MTQLQANIHPEAQIAPGVVIAPFATIEKDTIIGEGTWIGANAVINEGARIGKNCKIFPGAVISAIPQDMKFAGEVTTAEIGDHTTVREFVTISRGTADKYKTVVGKHCLIMAYAHIAHDCVVGDRAIIGNAVQMAGHCIIDEYAILSGMTAVHQFSKIGAHVMVSGGSLVKKDVPPYSTAGREPISFCGVNSIGLKRRGYSTERIEEIQEIYRIIYQSGLNISQALEKIETSIPENKERNQIIEFIRQSDRGIMKGMTE